MRACVLVKGVPDASRSRRVDPQTGRLDRSVESGLGSGDRYPVEAALQLREAGALGIDEVVAVTMGPATADRALRRALAMGCDGGVHLCDEALAGSDVIGTGYALACVLRGLSPRLVLLGERSADAGTAVLAGVIAAELELALATGVRALHARGDELEVERVTELGGQTLALAGPAVISVGADANTPRYASLKETMDAKRRRLQTLDCDAAAIDRARVGSAGAAVACGEWHQPPARRAGTVAEPASAQAGAELIVDWLAERGLL